ncbi:MAG: hypothetical protein ABJC66_11170 [Gammaproteobacteria bacterium]
MRLLDQIAQCQEPFLVRSDITGEVTRLSGAGDCAPLLRRCPTRYVLSDDLTRLCTELAYSKGTQVLDCIDLIHTPAELLWIEWCDAPWRETLREHGFDHPGDDERDGGRRGVLVRSTPAGQRGSIRAFWNTGDTDQDIFASAMEAHFYLDDPTVPDGAAAPDPTTLRVFAKDIDRHSVLTRCFHYEFEQSWANYYQREIHSPEHYRELQRQAAGTIAVAVPVLLAFFLLLGTRTGLPRQAADLSRLNRARVKAGRIPLLDHIEMRAPVLPDYQQAASTNDRPGVRRGPRLHHVRGHLVRRGSTLYWRVPHVRGKSRRGSVQTRTVIWTFDRTRTVSAPACWAMA